MVSGRATRPMGLVIDDAGQRLEDATGLRGAGAEAMRAALNGFDAWAGVGPAADAGVRFASVIADGRFLSGRGGLGLNMACRNLRFVAASGAGKVRVADPAALRKARKDILRLAAASSVLRGGHGYANYGSAALADLMCARGIAPLNNFRNVRVDDPAAISAVALRRRYASTGGGCRACHVRCYRAAADGLPMPGFEALGPLTTLTGVLDLDFAAQAMALCLEAGMDPGGAAAALACRFEVAGIDARGPEAARLGLDLLHDLAAGRAPELAVGAAEYARAAGRPEADMSVKGLELPPCDPRGAWGTALAVAVSARGSSLSRALAYGHEVLRKPVATDRLDLEGKARIVKNAEDALAVADSLTACANAFLAASLEEFAAAFQAVTGDAETARVLPALGERICYRERIMNARLGLDAAQDDLPARLFAPPEDAADDPCLDRGQFLDARARYYAVRGLDPEGWPTPETAARLGLDACPSRTDAP